MLTDEQITEIHNLVKKLYEKYPRYVVFSLTYSTKDSGETTLPPEKEMVLNIYTPLILHNYFTCFEKFKLFVEKLLVDGIKDSRMRVLKDRIAEHTETQKKISTVIKESQEELTQLE